MSSKISLRLEPLNPAIPGMGRLIIKGWNGDRKNLYFKIQRNIDHFYLDNMGNWSAGAIAHSLIELEQEQEDYCIILQSNLLDPLLKLPNAAYRFILTQVDGHESQGNILMQSNLLSSEAMGYTPNSTTVIKPQEPPISVSETQANYGTDIESGIVTQTKAVDNSSFEIERESSLGGEKKLQSKISHRMILICRICFIITTALVTYFFIMPQFLNLSQDKGFEIITEVSPNPIDNSIVDGGDSLSMGEEVPKEPQNILVEGASVLNGSEDINSMKPSSEVQSGVNENSGSHSENAIDPEQALNYIGQDKLVCGRLVSVYQFSKGIYLSLNQPYPETNFIGVIWDNTLSDKFNGINNVKGNIGNQVCLEGKLKLFNKRAEIILENRGQFQVQ